MVSPTEALKLNKKDELTAGGLTKENHLAILSKGVTTSRDLLKALSSRVLGRRSMTSVADSITSEACSKKGLTKFSTEALTACETAA